MSELSFNLLAFKCSKIELDENNEIARFLFDQALEVGNGKLKIKYNGVLNDKMQGFYKVKYKHSLAKEPYTATTQFEV